MLWWDRRTKGQLVAVLVMLIVLVAAAAIAVWRTRASLVADTPVPFESVTVEVGPNGVALDLGDVHITGPADVAPTGTTLTATLVHQAPTGTTAKLTTSADGISLDLDGHQPDKPLTLTMPAPRPPDSAAAAVLVTHRSDTAKTQLIAATYSPANGTITADVSHLSSFWPSFIRFDAVGDLVRDFLGQTTGLTGKRPKCVGTPATTTSGDTISLGGDFSVKANPVVWPCVHIEGDTAVVTLNANTPLPWRVRAAPNATLDPPGTVDVRKAMILSGYRTLVTHRPYAEGLLIPGVPMTYRLPAADLPGGVQGLADVGTYLGMALLFAFDVAISAFGVDTTSIGDSVETLSCLGDAVDAADLSTSSAGSELADFARAVLNCASTLVKAAGGALPGPAKVILTILGSGIALVTAGIQGATATLTNTDRFSIPIKVKYVAGGERWDKASLTLTANGLGAVRIDMSVKQAQQAAGATTAGPEDAYCQLYGLGDERTAPQAPWWRADSSGRVELILTGGSLYGSHPTMDVHTKEGIRLGDPLAKVKSTYKEKADLYVDIYGTTVVIVDGGTGNSMRFDSSNGATVDNMGAGRNDVIRFPELCG
jgi:hypothetical protein